MHGGILDRQHKDAGKGAMHIQDFSIVSDMSEVNRLLDHISGRWD